MPSLWGWHGASVWRDAVVGRGLAGCSQMHRGYMGQAEWVGGTEGGGRERLALSTVAEKLAPPCTLFQHVGEACFVSPPCWEVMWGSGDSPSPGAEAGVGRGRDGAGRLWGGIHQGKRGAV